MDPRIAVQKISGALWILSVISSLLVAIGSSLAAAPLTFKELDLMVRTHASEKEILDALTARSLEAPLDEAGMRKLRGDGASPALIEKIKNANPSPAEKVPGSPAQAAQPAAMPKLEELIPTEKIRVDVMVLQFPVRFMQLSERLSKAAAANKDWFAAYTKEHANEQPLPYNEKFGLTPPEYAEYVALGKQGRVSKIKDIDLLAKRSGSTIELRFDQETNLLQPVVIDLEKQTVTTPLVTMDQPDVRDSGDQGGALGRHQSYTWRAFHGKQETGTWASVDFMVGKQLEGGRRIIQYDVQQFFSGKPTIQFETLLFYP